MYNRPINHWFKSPNDRTRNSCQKIDVKISNINMFKTYLKTFVPNSFRNRYKYLKLKGRFYLV